MKSRIDSGTRSSGVDDPSARNSSAMTSHLRLRSLRAEVADLLRESPKSNSPRAPHGRFTVSKADSRPASPVGNLNRLSLSGQMRFAVLQFMSSVEAVLSRVNYRLQIELFRRLYMILAREKACVKMIDLITRKTLNLRFHALNDWPHDNAPALPSSVESYQFSVLPIASVAFDHILPFCANPENPHLAIYAGLGKVVGVILSVQRVEKLSVFSGLQRMRRPIVNR